MKNDIFNEVYHFVQKFTYENVNYAIYAPYCNINSRFLVEFKVLKVDVLDERLPEYVSILIQIHQDNPKEYDIRNVYWRQRNHQSEKFVSKYRKMLDNIVPLIKR